MIEYKLKSFYCAANKSFIEYKKCTQCESLMIVFKYRAKAPTTTTVYVLWQRKHFLLQLFIYIQNFWNIYFSINNLGYRYAFPVSLVKNKWNIFFYYVEANTCWVDLSWFVKMEKLSHFTVHVKIKILWYQDEKYIRFEVKANYES